MFTNFRKRLTVLYSMIISCVLVAVNVTVYFIVEEAIVNNGVTQLISFSKAMHKNKGKLGSQSENGLTQNIYLEQFLSLSSSIEVDQFSFLTDRHHHILLSSPNGKSLAHLFPSKILQQVPKGSHTTFEIRNRTYLVMGFPWMKKDRNTLFKVYVGRDITSTEHLLHQLRIGLGIFTLLLILISILVGSFFSHKAMVPIMRSYYQQQDFVANASHELRTSLSILYSSTEILEESRIHLSDLHQKMLINVKEEIERLTQMVESLLILARSDDGTFVKKNDPIDLKAIISNVVVNFETITMEKKICLEVEVEGDADFFCCGDADLMKQLLFILFDNAIKYNKQNGAVSVRLHNRNKKNVTLSVQDTGIGIKEKDLPLIFNRFYRADQVRSRDIEGTGLGLSIAYEIVKSFGGKIKVTSVINKGTTFTVQLPNKK